MYFHLCNVIPSEARDLQSAAERRSLASLENDKSMGNCLLNTDYWLLLLNHIATDVIAMLAITASELRHRMHHTPSTRASM